MQDENFCQRSTRFYNPARQHGMQLPARLATRTGKEEYIKRGLWESGREKPERLRITVSA